MINRTTKQLVASEKLACGRARINLQTTGAIPVEHSDDAMHSREIDAGTRLLLCQLLLSSILLSTLSLHCYTLLLTSIVRHSERTTNRLH